MDDKFHQILKRYWGYDSFRPLQLDTIRSVAQGEDTLVLMPTGGGKSLTYQIPALAADGVCVVITPLIALMKDQVDSLKKRRILAEAIHSGVSQRNIDRILDNCVWGDVKFLYISPERIDSEMFAMRFAKMNVSLIAVDEAHCISQWGYDFRPAYLKIKRLRTIQPETPILALTASATPKVAQDIMDKLNFLSPNVRKMSFARKNLCYIVRHCEDKNEQLLRILRNVGGQGIVYARTRQKSEQLADMLRGEGISADSYHGGMGHITRNAKQDEWISGRVQVMVATNAFGMGIDKADVRFVVHYDVCDSLEEYYQEAGRAGRDGLTAYAVMLVSPQESGRAARRISMDFPPLDSIKSIYEKICGHLQIGIGEGKDRSFSFNLYDFCHKASLFPPTFINAAKILQMNDYMTLTEEMENPTRVRFTVLRDQLYRLRVNRKELDHFITVLMRRYSGIFSQFVSIREEELAQISGYTIEHIMELLKTLRQLHVIQYIPSNRDPRIFMTEERLPTADLRISPESYNIRKRIAEERSESVLKYIESDDCRSLSIQRYFGEQSEVRCGKCDVCRELNKTEMSSVDDKIILILSSTRSSIKELVSQIKCDPNEILGALTRMMESGIVGEGEDGKLFLIT